MNPTLSPSPPAVQGWTAIQKFNPDINFHVQHLHERSMTFSLVSVLRCGRHPCRPYRTPNIKPFSVGTRSIASAAQPAATSLNRSYSSMDNLEALKRILTLFTFGRSAGGEACIPTKSLYRAVCRDTAGRLLFRIVGMHCRSQRATPAP
jgi:hypothetical protein